MFPLSIKRESLIFDITKNSGDIDTIVFIMSYPNPELPKREIRIKNIIKLIEVLPGDFNIDATIRLMLAL